MNTATRSEPRQTPLVLKSRRALEQELEQEIAQRVADERRRLEEQARARQTPSHFRRPIERPFTAAERDGVTILFGGLTWKHEWLIRSAFESAGYKVALLPTPDVAGFQLGKEYGNNGQCNPTYFMVGHLIKYLQSLEAQGLSRQQIVDNYVFFTAGSCGPCRFGMYEAEYRLGVQNAGFDGFRILLFQQDDGINAASGEAGLKFTVDFGLGAFNAINFGDVLNDVCCQIRPYEAMSGETDRAFTDVMEHLSAAIRDRRMFHVSDRAPAWLAKRILANHVAESITHPLLDMQELATLAQPYYHRFARGGEGHLEVAKNIYYTVHKKAHMVLSLKPFGCMPSSQSDGVQSAVMNHFKDMIFLPIETSGEGEINAHSRVQMALGEAKAKAKAEFQQALDSTGKRLEDIRGYVEEHANLRRPFYRVPHQARRQARPADPPGRPGRATEISFAYAARSTPFRADAESTGGLTHDSHETSRQFRPHRRFHPMLSRPARANPSNTPRPSAPPPGGVP